jgi:hypothetical protein
VDQNPDSQHMKALERANKVRFARAELKKEVLKKPIVLLETLENPPDFTYTMRLGELVGAQMRWGPTRTRKFLHLLALKESVAIGKMTLRQRRLVIDALQDKIKRRESK